VFDWGGTLSVFADVEMIDMWRLAARHLAPDQEAEMIERLIAVEARSWEEVRDHQTSTTLSNLLATASQELGLDVAEAVLEEAATHHLDTWTPHIEHDPDAAPTLAALRDAGHKIGLLSNTHWPRAFHEHFLERDGLVELVRGQGMIVKTSNNGLGQKTRKQVLLPLLKQVAHTAQQLNLSPQDVLNQLKSLLEENTRE